MTGIIAVGLTFVILTAEIDLSVGAVANATAIVLTFFTLQPDYVNIGNIPMPGAVAIILALLACVALGLVTAIGVTRIGIPSFIMTLAMMQIGAGISAVLVRGTDCLHSTAAHPDTGVEIDRSRTLDHYCGRAV